MAAKGKTAEVDRRGHLELELGGETYGLRPSFEAIEAIERKVEPIEALASRARQGQLPVREMGSIVAELMRAYGEAHPSDPLKTTYAAANPEKLSRLIYEAGATRVRLTLYVILAGAMTGGYDASGEAKPATEETMTSTPAAGSLA